MRQYLNWKTYLIIAALSIVGATLYYTNRLAVRLAAEERKGVQQLADGFRDIASAKENMDLSFIQRYIEQNTTVPVILTDERANIVDYKNLDTTSVADPKAFLAGKLGEFKAEHQPLVINYGTGSNFIYYGESYLLTQLRYFPYVQMTIILLFLAVVLIALGAAHRSIQNQVWVGLSKETAHQLGTPLSSITGWIELLADRPENTEAVEEMRKDLLRLQLVADRFSKIGSTPTLEEQNLIERLQGMTDYMQKRAPAKVSIGLHRTDDEVPVMLSGPLFDWVMENLIRNALDAMDGKGSIDITVKDENTQVIIDVKDTGKGMAKHVAKRVFVPGFSTKKRGWGLGLSLSKRVIEKYHKGALFVKSSEPGKGTTFRIVLKR